MNRKEIDLLLSRIEGLKSFLENNSLENFQQEILNVENYLKRFGSFTELLSHLENVEKIAYAAKEFLNIDEVAAYLQVSKGYVYKLTMQKELTVYKPNGKNIFILRDDLNRWIKRNPLFLQYRNRKASQYHRLHIGTKKVRTNQQKGGKK
ncbi:helix-turn-helix domain-containing protein [Bacteroides ovatus]|nr:helix-turn-helix domain-containing protein [Bacteroides ovatus]